MKSRHVIFCFFFCLLTGTGLFFAGNARALEWDYSGRLSGWITETTDHDSWQNSLGLLYIPQVSLKKYLGEESFLDAEVSVNFVMPRPRLKPAWVCKKSISVRLDCSVP
ncbi:MAG: hypothetical protein JRF41_11545 [Deltaproteobacteria bacterium]|nr:hypothetical protein [Deltaproteobacteria bacterium]